MPDIQNLIPLVLTLLVAFTFHEFAHAWVAYRLGDDTAFKEGRVTLNPLSHLDPLGTVVFIVSQQFGWAKPVPVNPTNFKHPRRDDILVTVAGPLTNLVLAFLSALLLIFLFGAKYGIITNEMVKSTPVFELLLKFLNMMVSLNFLLFFFNMIPIHPLDGSHIVTNLLPLNQAYQFKRFNEQYGGWILLVLVMAGNRLPINPLNVLVFQPSVFCQNWLLSLLK